MARKPPDPACSEEDRKTLEVWARSRTLESRLVERAKNNHRLFGWKAGESYCTGTEGTSQHSD